MERNKKKRVRVELPNGTIYSSINQAAKSLGVYPMQIYVMIVKGKAKLLE